MTVVLLVLDGLGARSMAPDVMPTLTGWAGRGLHRPEGATSVLASSTYPNFASIATGTLPERHGLFANVVLVEGEPRPAAQVGPDAPGLFDGGSEVVVGDHNLIGVMAARGARWHWPSDGVIPDGTDLDMFGYVADGEVVTRVVEALERKPEFLFAQMNSPDTVAHVFGPDSDEAKETYRALDAQLAVIGAALDLSRDLVMVTSDHDQETVEPERRIDLASVAAKHGIEVTVVDEGTAAMLGGPGGADTAWLTGIEGVEDWIGLAPSLSLVFSEPRWWFGGPAMPGFRGAHGGRRTRATVAVAVGAPHLLAAIAPGLGAPVFGAEDWRGLVEIGRTMGRGL
jgi:hypothetical protein